MSNFRLKQIHRGMIRRCHDPRRKDYCRYGAKGIVVSEEWQSFENFKNWSLLNGYSDNLSIDRIDNEKGYSSENCRWATNRQQSLNRRLYKSSSGYRGVTRNRNKWKSRASVGRKRVYVGIYDTPEEAAKAYNDYVLKNNTGNLLNKLP